MKVGNEKATTGDRAMKRRTIVGLLAAMTAFAAVFGSAASLGGISSSNLGADDSVIAACDTNGVGVSYTESYSAAAPAGYKLTAVTVSGVADACDGQTVAVTLTNSSDASLGSGSQVIPTSAAVDHTVNVAPPAAAQSITGVHVVISA